MKHRKATAKKYQLMIHNGKLVYKNPRAGSLFDAETNKPIKKEGNFMMAYEYINKINSANSIKEIDDIYNAAKRDIVLSQLDLFCVRMEAVVKEQSIQDEENTTDDDKRKV